MSVAGVFGNGYDGVGVDGDARHPTSYSEWVDIYYTHTVLFADTCVTTRRLHFVVLWVFYRV